MSVKSGLSYCLAYIATQHEYIRWDSQQQTKTNNIYRYCHSLLTWNRWTQNAGSHGQAGASSEHIKQHQTTDLIARLGAKFALCSSRSDSRMVRPQAAGPRLLYLTHPSPSHLYPPLFFLHTPRPQATRGSTRPPPSHLSTPSPQPQPPSAPPVRRGGPMGHLPEVPGHHEAGPGRPVGRGEG